MTLFDAGAAIEAVRSGTIDASFRALTMPARHRGNPHPALARLRSYLRSAQPARREPGTWTPPWAEAAPSRRRQ